MGNDKKIDYGKRIKKIDEELIPELRDARWKLVSVDSDRSELRIPESFYYRVFFESGNMYKTLDKLKIDMLKQLNIFLGLVDRFYVAERKNKNLLVIDTPEAKKYIALHQKELESKKQDIKIALDSIKDYWQSEEFTDFQPLKNTIKEFFDTHSFESSKDVRELIQTIKKRKEKLEEFLRIFHLRDLDGSAWNVYQDMLEITELMQSGDEKKLTQKLKKLGISREDAMYLQINLEDITTYWSVFVKGNDKYKDWNEMLEYIRNHPLMTWNDILKEYDVAISFGMQDYRDIIADEIEVYKEEKAIKFAPYEAILHEPGIEYYIHYLKNIPRGNLLDQTKLDTDPAFTQPNLIKYYDYMNDEEKGVYLYILERYSSEEAEKYLEAIKDNLNYRIAEDEALKFINNLNDLNFFTELENKGLALKNGFFSFLQDLESGLNLFGAVNALTVETHTSILIAKVLTEEPNMEEIEKDPKLAKMYEIAEKIKPRLKTKYAEKFEQISSFGYGIIPVVVSLMGKGGVLISGAMWAAADGGKAKQKGYEKGMSDTAQVIYGLLSTATSIVLSVITAKLAPSKLNPGIEKELASSESKIAGKIIEKLSDESIKELEDQFVGLALYGIIQWREDLINTALATKLANMIVDGKEIDFDEAEFLDWENDKDTILSSFLVAVKATKSKTILCRKDGISHKLSLGTILKAVKTGIRGLSSLMDYCEQHRKDCHASEDF